MPAFKVNDLQEANQLLEEIAPVAEPVIRGDRPYSFTYRRVLEAFLTAKEVYLFAGHQLENQKDPMFHKASIPFAKAGTYMRALAREAREHSDAPEEAKQLLEYYDLIQRYISEHLILSKLPQAV